GMFFILCRAVAAACAFARVPRRWARRSRAVFAAFTAMVTVVESWPAMVVAGPPASVAALNRAESGAPLVELPVGLVDRDIAALYRSIGHGRPIVNGYSGFSPPHYLVLQVALRYDDLDALREL